MSDVDPLSGAYCKEHDIYLCDECYLRKGDALTVLNVQLNRGEITFDHYREQALALGYVQISFTMPKEDSG